MTKLTLEYWKDEGWLVGRIVEVPGVFSQGETLDELKENIQDAYKLMLQSEEINSAFQKISYLPHLVLCPMRHAVYALCFTFHLPAP